MKPCSTPSVEIPKILTNQHGILWEALNVVDLTTDFAPMSLAVQITCSATTNY